MKYDHKVLLFFYFSMVFSPNLVEEIKICVFCVFGEKSLMNCDYDYDYD